MKIYLAVPAGHNIVCTSGLLGSVEGAEPDTTTLLRVADLSGPFSPRAFADAPKLDRFRCQAGVLHDLLLSTMSICPKKLND